MNQYQDDLRKVLEDAGSRLAEDTLRTGFDETIRKLLIAGKVQKPLDYMLTGKSLEVRCQVTMEQMGLTVREGRTMMEDLIVLVPQGAEPTYPLVVEVKSGKDPSPDKQALRELDDWVFDLSGEDLIRKMQHPGDASVGLFTHGMFTWRPHHPSPHKGVFIYNGPTYVPFEQRSPNWLGYNEEAFAKKRGFCVMALCTLINFADRVKNGAVQLDALWKLIHDTEGVLPPPK